MVVFWPAMKDDGSDSKWAEGFAICLLEEGLPKMAFSGWNRWLKGKMEYLLSYGGRVETQEDGETMITKESERSAGSETEKKG